MSCRGIGRGLTAVASVAAVVVAAGVSTPAVAARAAAMGPMRAGCEWVPDVLALPPDTFHGQVSAGAGEWFAGVAGADGPNEAVRWRDGRVEPLGAAFGLDTKVTAVNDDGVVVGTVTGADGDTHAIRNDGTGFERLPETGGTSLALDVNTRGDVLGHDGRRLVVWPAAGPPRFLALPPGEAPYGYEAIDDDGTVAARLGYVAAGALRWRGHAWTPTGTRMPLPEGDVQDLRHGQIVGAMGSPDAVTSATGWRLHGGHRSYLGGGTAVALNEDGLVAGENPDGEPLLWNGVLPTPLTAPPDHDAPAVAAVNATEVGGLAFPEDGDGSEPVRWRCR
jgi:hypothetical protein